MDILDTSVIRGMSKQSILAIREERMIAVSPFTLWEILCHLDEVNAGETPATAFPRRRGHVAILQHLDLLHDPFAEHADTVGASHLANHTRFEDRDVARQIIAEVLSVSTIEELDQRLFTHPDGTRASFRNLAENTRNALEHEEQQFIHDMQFMWERLQGHHRYTRPSDLSVDDVWSWIRAMLTALRNSYAQDSISGQELFIRVCDSMYLYYGYLLFRLRTYGIGNNGQLAIQPNDTEDAYICMHMRLFDEHMFVVGDGKTRRAIQQAIDLWNERMQEVPAHCGVMDLPQYTALAKAICTRKSAYYRWQNRGCPKGDDWTDWFEAEQEA